MALAGGGGHDERRLILHSAAQILRHGGGVYTVGRAAPDKFIASVEDGIGGGDVESAGFVNAAGGIILLRLDAPFHAIEKHGRDYTLSIGVGGSDAKARDTGDARDVRTEHCRFARVAEHGPGIAGNAGRVRAGHELTIIRS